MVIIVFVLSLFQVPFSSLHVLYDEFCYQPAHAIPCSIADIQVHETNEAAEYLKALINCQLLRAIVVSIKDNFKLRLDLYKIDLDIGQKMIDNGMAIFQDQVKKRVTFA